MLQRYDDDGGLETNSIVISRPGPPHSISKRRPSMAVCLFYEVMYDGCTQGPQNRLHKRSTPQPALHTHAAAQGGDTPATTSFFFLGSQVGLDFGNH